MSPKNKKNHENRIRLIKSSSAEAFRDLFNQYQNDMYHFIFYMVGDSFAAEDILQDVFVKLWENRHDIKENVSIRSYLYTIAKNLSLNYIRHQKVVRKYQQEIQIQHRDALSSSPQSIIEFKEFSEWLIKALENLPEQQRIVFMMSRFDQLSYKDIAERLQITIKTVETHIGRALKSLAKQKKALS